MAATTRMQLPSAGEWATWGLLILVYALWLGSTLASAHLPTPVVAALGGFIVCLHGSLQHEAIHGHPTSIPWLNSAAVALPLSLWMPYGRYRELHRAHHRAPLTDPLQDPESWYVSGTRWDAMPRWRRLVLRVNHTLLGRLTIGPPLAVFGFWRAEWRAIRDGDTQVIRDWCVHLAGAVAVWYWVCVICGLSMGHYVALYVYPGLALTLLRSFLEHRPGEHDHERTAIVEGSWLTQLLFLNNNFHLVHHEQPDMPWYRIKRAYREGKDRWLSLNGHYFYPGYWDVFRRFAVQPKEHPCHPPGKAYPQAAVFRPGTDEPPTAGFTTPARSPAVGRVAPGRRTPRLR